ncbi:MAG TPA: hypothetical protein VFS59_05580 [Gemmatimonadaceae bacterium]|nr:hypothetical protein [Gemmatimonadaceae bacterium]
MQALERLVQLLAAQYRWGLHPLKLLVALLVPVAIVWLADRRLRAMTAGIVQEEARLRGLPRVRRR